MNANLHPKAPCNQPFNKAQAAAASGKGSQNLERRLIDYDRMTNDPKFKNEAGYHKPGSNKK